MMRQAYFGMNSLFLIIFHLILVGLDLMGFFPYFRTLFYPMFLIIALLIAIVGAFEKDKVKWPGIVGLVIAGGLFIHWAILLIMRLTA